jgi:hypothetical protein
VDVNVRGVKLENMDLDLDLEGSLPPLTSDEESEVEANPTRNEERHTRKKRKLTGSQQLRIRKKVKKAGPVTRAGNAKREVAGQFGAWPDKTNWNGDFLKQVSYSDVSCSKTQG